MKKNIMMKIASVLLIAVLLTTCVISGTFAKYTQQVSSDDSARVAKWGFNTASIDFENLFKPSYANVANGSDEMAIIAPGTSGEATFIFENALDGDAKPEVAYTFTVSTAGSSCADNILANNNITWTLKTADETIVDAGTWNALITALEALDGDEEYNAGEIPAMVDTQYTILWNWAYNNTTDGNAAPTNDSYLGNAAVAADQVVTLKITITATQIAG